MANGKIKADTLEHSTAGSLDTSYVVNGSAPTARTATTKEFRKTQAKEKEESVKMSLTNS